MHPQFQVSYPQSPHLEATFRITSSTVERNEDNLPRPCFANALLDAVRVTMEPAVAASRGILDVGMSLFLNKIR